MGDPGHLPTAYIPPHRRQGEGVDGAWVSLETLVSPDDSVSVVAGPSFTTPLNVLSTVMVATVLRNLGLGKYAQACLDAPLRGKDLALCEDDDLKEIGIHFRPHRLSLLQEVKTFMVDGVPSHLLSIDDSSAPPSSAARPAAGFAAGEPAPDDHRSTASETPTWIKSAQKELDETAPITDGATAMGTSGTHAPDTSSGRPQASVVSTRSVEDMSVSTAVGGAGRPARSVEDTSVSTAVGGRRRSARLEAMSISTAVRGADSRGPGGFTAQPSQQRGIGNAVAAAQLPTGPAAHFLPSDLSMIAGKLENLSLRSEVGTAVRPVERRKGRGV